MQTVWAGGCDTFFVKTVRFSQVVQKAGRPEVYLTLTSPAKDRRLQSAIKAHKVMTVRQENAGGAMDRGEIGFDEGPERQYLVFPRSLARFSNRKVVGIKYDLIEDPEVAPSQIAKLAQKRKKAKPKRKASRSFSKALADALATSDGDSSQETAPKQHVERPKRERDSSAAPSRRKKASHEGEVAALRKMVRKAMVQLEKGKAVAAFNLLKQIADA